MKHTETLPYPPLSDVEFLTIEQLAKRLKVSRATLFTWMQKGILAKGLHYFKQGRVLRFIWCKELIYQLLESSPENGRNLPPVSPSIRSIQRKKSNPINWDY